MNYFFDFRICDDIFETTFSQYPCQDKDVIADGFMILMVKLRF